MDSRQAQVVSGQGIGGTPIPLRRATLALALSCLAALTGLLALSPTAHAAPTYRYTDQSTSYIGNEANSYVIGYLFPGTYADVQHVSPSGEFGYGRIGSTSNFGAWDNGHYCGWVQIVKEGATLMTKGSKVSSEDVCPAPEDGNLAPAAIFKSGTYEAGCGTGCVQSAVVLTQCRDLNVYANYDPQTGGIFDPDGTESPGRGTPGYGGVPQQSVTTPIAGFGTRYMTKDSNVVLIKDTSRPGEKTAWGFMRSECIAGSQVGNPARPPEAFTNAQSELTGTSAKLNGSVDPSGNPTSYYFEWGPTTSYGNFTPGPPPGMAIGHGEEFVYTWNVIGGLAPGATYHYRVVATNGGTTRYGADQSFTEPPPPAATTAAASEVQQTTAKLNGSVNPNGLDTHYYFEYGLTTGYGSTIPVKPGMDLGAGTSSILTWNVASELQPGTTYHYRVVASSSAGTSYGGDQALMTPGEPPAAVFMPDGNLHVATLGANYSLNDIVRLPSWSWQAPFAAAGSLTTYSAPAEAVDSSGNLYIAAEGPNHTLSLTERFADGSWHGPFQEAGAGTTYSAPAMTLDKSGNLYIFAEGPNNTLQETERFPDWSWHGPYQVAGNGTTYSAPAVVMDSSQNIFVMHEGPNNTLQETERFPDWSWHGPYQVAGNGTTYSAPAVVMDSSQNIFVMHEGPNNTLQETERFPDWSWHGPYQVAGNGTTYSAPAVAMDSSQNIFVMHEGPNNTLQETERFPDWSWHGPYQVAGNGTTYSAPAVAMDSSQNIFVMHEGPNNTLQETERFPDWSWHGPYQVAGNGTTY